jgi:hypothetical protein
MTSTRLIVQAKQGRILAPHGTTTPTNFSRFINGSDMAADSDLLYRHVQLYLLDEANIFPFLLG